MQSPRIFIAGTGRSGTTLLYDIFRSSPDIYALPVETRFLIDNDGLIDLIDSLTTRYSPAKGRVAIQRFETMMLKWLTDPDTVPYPGFRLDDWIGEQYYITRVKEFMETMKELVYPGRTWQTARGGHAINLDQLVIPFVNRLRRTVAKPVLRPPSRATIVPRFFPDRSRLIRLASQFVDDLFIHPTARLGKRTWCEKTPHNLLHVDFLWELFPDAVIVHMKRDPRAVAYSYSRQMWAPSELRDSCRMLRHVYERWYSLSDVTQLNRARYLEVKLEDLGADPRAVMGRIADFCGVSNDFPALETVKMEKVDYWEKKVSPETLTMMNGILADDIERMGYVR